MSALEAYFSRKWMAFYHFFTLLLSLFIFHKVLISISFYIKREFLVNIKTLLTLLVPIAVRQLYSCRAFTICQQKPKILVGNSNGTAHSSGKFLKKMEIFRGIPLFAFQLEWVENRCTMCELPRGLVHLVPSFPPFIEDFSKLMPLQRGNTRCVQQFWAAPPSF